MVPSEPLLTPTRAAEKVSSTTELRMSAVNLSLLMKWEKTALKESWVAQTSE